MYSVFIQLNRWNNFHFLVFDLRFQKSLMQSYISFSFLSSISVFLFLKKIPQLSKQKQTSAIFQARGFLCNGRGMTIFPHIHSSLVKFRRSRCWLDERYFFTVIFCRSCSWLATFKISTNLSHYEFSWINLSTYDINIIYLLSRCARREWRVVCGLVAQKTTILLHPSS